MTHRGFILQPTYRLEGDRPVLLLYGVLEGGRSFLVRETAAGSSLLDSPGGRRPGPPPGRDGRSRGHRHAARWAASRWRRVELSRPSAAPALRDRLVAAGVPCFEADVRFAYRYLIDRGIRGSLEIAGERRPRPRSGRAASRTPGSGRPTGRPTLSVLSFDIETDPAARRLLSMSLHGCGAAEVLLLTPEGCDLRRPTRLPSLTSETCWPPSCAACASSTRTC